MLVDSHCHLNYDGLSNDTSAIIARAEEASIKFLLTINTKISDFPDVLAICRKFQNVACSVGIHPHETINQEKIDAQALIALTKHPKVVGIGETGLDFHYNNSPADRQEESFRAHIKASRETQLPIIIHTREADDRMISILNEEQNIGSFPGVIHCFSSGKKLAECALKHDMAISISGIITFKNADQLRNTVSQIPIEYLLLETDAPFLAPVPYRGKINEPSYMLETANKVAEILSITPDKLAEHTTDNFFRIFSKAQRPL